ncbi:CAP Gly-rich domain-containing protein [Syncephalis fuscata]|nr:CAP Gly-rich domain-containing protein [Syncephalis fuscata]
MSIVILMVTSDASHSERRFNKSMSIEELKTRLEPITGIPSSSQTLSIYDKNRLVASVVGDDRMLGYFSPEDYMELRVGDTRPVSVREQYTDVSQVEKYEMPDEEYAKRSDSMLAFKRRNKLGRFADGASMSSMGSTEMDENFGEKEASEISVGDRCQVDLSGGGYLKRGVVRFVGKTEFKSGYWIGIQYDEPVGKNNGTVQGKSYFECLPNYGSFVRPTAVTVGDFPEEDIDLDELDEI